MGFCVIIEKKTTFTQFGVIYSGLGSIAIRIKQNSCEEMAVTTSAKERIKYTVNRLSNLYVRFLPSINVLNLPKRAFDLC